MRKGKKERMREGMKERKKEGEKEWERERKKEWEREKKKEGKNERIKDKKKQDDKNLAFESHLWIMDILCRYSRPWNDSFRIHEIRTSGIPSGKLPESTSVHEPKNV